MSANQCIDLKNVSPERAPDISLEMREALGTLWLSCNGEQQPFWTFAEGETGRSQKAIVPPCLNRPVKSDSAPRIYQ